LWLLSNSLKMCWNFTLVQPEKEAVLGAATLQCPKKNEVLLDLRFLSELYRMWQTIDVRRHGMLTSVQLTSSTPDDSPCQRHLRNLPRHWSRSFTVSSAHDFATVSPTCPRAFFYILFNIFEPESVAIHDSVSKLKLQ